MINFSAIVPHPPMLIPTIGKENAKRAEATGKAIASLSEALYVSRPETVVIISPHGQTMTDAFSINLASNYKVSFKDFGDYQTTKEFPSDFMLIDKIQRSARKETPLVLGSQEELDYGAGVPLTLLGEHLSKVSLVPVLTSGLDLKAHYDFGRLLKEEITSSNKRVALIASADLSHTLSQEAPAGFAKEGQELDKAVQELIANKNAAGLIGLDAGLREKAHECGIRAILILLGMLDGVQYEPKVLSYEYPFGVGYLVANLVLS
jgi:AmmeMemoRadiSam system protein B